MNEKRQVLISDKEVERLDDIIRKKGYPIASP